MADADFERCDNNEIICSTLLGSSSQEQGDEEQAMNEFHDSIANIRFNMRG